MNPSHARHIGKFLRYANRLSSKSHPLICRFPQGLCGTDVAYPCSVLKGRHLETLSSARSSSEKDFQDTDSQFSQLDNDSGDVFGTIRTPLERKMSVKKSKSAQQNNVPPIKKPEKFKKNLKRSSKSSYKVVDEADKFGGLSEDSPMWYSENPIEDDDPEPGDDSRLEIPVEKKFKNAQSYLQEMQRLVKEKKLKEALELIPDMHQNRVYPIVSNYTFLIGACGRAGYTEMAFKLLRQMTDRAFHPTCAVLTGLFNSCAESPFPEYGLKKATMLREKIAEKNWLLNRPGYHAMIKAFGKCGDIGTAFEIVDEMIEKKIGVTVHTYSFLLMTCIADRDAGFTHAVQVCRKMISKKILPDIYIFNLLLRAVRDCGIGPEEISCLLLQHWSSYRKRPYGLNAGDAIDKSDMLMLPNPEFSDTKLIGSLEKINLGSSPETADRDSVNHNQRDELVLQPSKESNLSVDIRDVCPNILTERPLKGPEFIDLSNIRTASDRLALVGNAVGFLKMMKNYKISPDIKTFMLLLESLPPTTKAEDELLSLLETYKVHPDTDFFNILIKRRNVRHDFLAAKNVLLLLNKHNLSPDIVTFGVLALGCRSVKQGNFLLRDMKDLGVAPNIEILGALITSACKMMNFGYLSHLLKVMRVESVQPNERILTKIEDTLDRAREAILQKEQGKHVDEFYLHDNFSEELRNFNSFYSDWLHVMKVEDLVHPWEQYKADIRLRKKESS